MEKKKMTRKKKAPTYIQLDLIPPTEAEKLYAEFKEVKESSDKVRRGVFAKQTDLSKRVEDLTCKLENLQKQLVVLSEWTITRLGSVTPAPQKPVENLGMMCLPTTSLNVMFADKLHPLHLQEAMDGLFLSA